MRPIGIGLGVGFIAGAGVTPVAAWDASTSTLAQLTALASVSRPSLATMFDSTGKLTYAPNNLALNTATLGTQTVTVQSGVSYILSIKGTGSVTLTGASTAGPLNGTGASNRVDLKITAATSSLTLTVSGSVTSARLSAVTYETAFRSGDDVDTTASAYYGPRIDYDPNTLAVKGLLIEGEPRTNLQPVSDLSASTTLNAATVATGQAAPDGTNGARKIIADATAGFHYATQALATTSGVLYSTSFFAYAPDAGYTLVGGASNTGTIGTFDLATGTATSGTNMAASMRQVGTLAGKPVYKCVWQWTAAANNNQAYFYAPNASNTIAALAGNGTSGVVIWGVQTEAGAKDTSLIITSGAAATRAADIVTLKGPALTAASGSAATLISEWDAINASFSVSNPSMFVANAGYPLLRANNATTLAANSAAGNSQTLTVSGGTFSANYRVGVAYSASGFSLGANGATTTSASAFTSPSTVYVGGFSGAANLTGNNHLRSIAVYDQRLPDATFQAKSVLGASY